MAELMLDGEPAMMGVIADRVSQAIDIALADIEPAPPFGTRVRPDYLVGVGKVKGADAPTTGPRAPQYTEKPAGKSALLAEVKDCVGQLVAPNQIVWPDAFTDFRADYRLTLRRDGVEADVILREVDWFTQGAPLSDDRTLVVAKVR